MKQIFVLGLIVALAACKSADGKQMPAESPEPAKPTMESVRAEACSCADEDCADRMMAEMEIQRRQFEAAYAEATVCVQKHKPAPPRVEEEILGKMREFRGLMCACADKACVENVERSMMEWAMKNMEKMKNMRPSKADEEEADRIDDEMDRCKERAEGS